MQLRWSVQFEFIFLTFSRTVGLHVTLRRPYWWSRTKTFLSSGNWTPFSCKFFENKFYGTLPSSKTLTFKMRPSAQPFLWKWVLFAWEWKIISISKAEHLTSFWYRGPGELGNGLLYWPQHGLLVTWWQTKNTRADCIQYFLSAISSHEA